jgi:pre-mRNA-splicing factor SYF1
MSVYDRAVTTVSDDDRLKVFEIYLAKAASFFGLSSTRDIYSKAIEILPDAECRKICLDFASTEIKLGEIDRARAIYIHGSQMADPEINPDYWKIWSDFEVRYGNEETFKEMLRVKRSVLAKYSSQAAYMSAKLLAASKAGQEIPAVPGIPSEAEQPKTMADLEAMVIAEQEAQALPGFVRATVTEPEKENPDDGADESGKGNVNPDEIELEDSDEDIETVAVPAAVFGSLKRKTGE